MAEVSVEKKIASLTILIVQLNIHLKVQGQKHAKCFIKLQLSLCFFMSLDTVDVDITSG